MMRTPLLLLAVLALAPAVGAVDLPGGVDVVDFAFKDRTTGAAVTLATVGAPVVWTGVEGAHTVTAEDGSFDSGTLLAGETFTRVFDAPTVVVYDCAFHPAMRAVLVVA